MLKISWNLKKYSKKTKVSLKCRFKYASGSSELCLVGRGEVGGRGAYDSLITFSHVNLFFFFLIKVNDKRFCSKKSLQYFLFLPVILSVLSYQGRSNDHKIQKSWGFAPDTIRWVYIVSTALSNFSFCKNYKYLLCTLPVQSLRPSDGPVHVEILQRKCIQMIGYIIWFYLFLYWFWFLATKTFTSLFKKYIVS